MSDNVERPSDSNSPHPNGSVQNKRKKKTRTVFSRAQVFQLESTFDLKRFVALHTLRKYNQYKEAQIVGGHGHAKQSYQPFSHKGQDIRFQRRRFLPFTLNPVFDFDLTLRQSESRISGGCYCCCLCAVLCANRLHCQSFTDQNGNTMGAHGGHTPIRVPDD